jgi:hypothetical protein
MALWGLPVSSTGSKPVATGIPPLARLEDDLSDALRAALMEARFRSRLI